jgi:cyclopropane-fatty-acyl-phospholipid synthase
MWGEGLFGRTARRIAGRAVTGGLQRLAERVRADGGAPLELVLPTGERIEFGQSPRLRLTVRDADLVPALANPTIGQLAEWFVEGHLDVDGDVMDAVACAEKLAAAGGSSAAARVAASFARHTPKEDREAISHHYDVSNAFYRLWLDSRMVYSCAYFRDPADTLEMAQEAKLDHICRKLRLNPGERFLDIGCGWGGLVIHAAERYGVSAVGITLSKNQFELAQERVQERGLAERVQILLLDYRELVGRFGAGAFDKVASIGMFEHVGLKNLGEYFGTVAQCLRDRGLFLNHGITSTDVDNRPVGSGSSEFIDKYVFPHGELPHVHLALREMSAAGFEVADVESLRRHYALTLAHWSRRLEERREEAAKLVPEKTLRVWRVYLPGCSYGFEQGWMNIYQLLGSRQLGPGITALPLTRDWMYERG